MYSCTSPGPCRSMRSGLLTVSAKRNPSAHWCEGAAGSCWVSPLAKLSAIRSSLAPVTTAYSILFPLFSGFKAGQSANLRLALLYNTFSASYLLLSQSWEVLFLVNYAVIVATWMNSETSSRAPASVPYRLIQTSDAARALTFLFLVHAVSQLLYMR